MFAVHHFTLSVRNIDNMTEFYSTFDFRCGLKWSAADGSLSIAHLINADGFIIELFQYRSNLRLPALKSEVGNNLPDLGVKHIAFKVADLKAAYASFQRIENIKLGLIVEGRTGITYFFVCDPDGNWIEIVQDDRVLK